MRLAPAAPAACLLLCLAACGAPPAPPAPETPLVATFSIAACDPATGDLGVAVQSRVFAVGVVVPWVRADVGAVATQALANPAYGPDGLALLDDGVAAAEVVQRLVAADAGRARRQLGVVDARGRAAAFTGRETLAWAGHLVGEGYCCQGNILAGAGVVRAMAKAFEASSGPLAERLVQALQAGQAAGGDKRGRQSAALVVARRGGGYLAANDRYVDIRVDDHPRPIRELARLLVKRRGFGRDARVPERPYGAVREPRHPVDGASGARATWRRWRRLGREGDWKAALALTNRKYRETRTPADLAAAQADAARGDYVGTVFGPEDAVPRMATLWFAVPRERGLARVLLVREADAWRVVP